MISNCLGPSYTCLYQTTRRYGASSITEALQREEMSAPVQLYHSYDRDTITGNRYSCKLRRIMCRTIRRTYRNLYQYPQALQPSISFNNLSLSGFREFGMSKLKKPFCACRPYGHTRSEIRSSLSVATKSCCFFSYSITQQLRSTFYPIRYSKDCVHSTGAG